jgi:hypothetical protein
VHFSVHLNTALDTGFVLLLLLSHGRPWVHSETKTYSSPNIKTPLIIFSPLNRAQQLDETTTSISQSITRDSQPDLGASMHACQTGWRCSCSPFVGQPRSGRRHHPIRDRRQVVAGNTTAHWRSPGVDPTGRGQGYTTVSLFNHEYIRQ